MIEVKMDEINSPLPARNVNYTPRVSEVTPDMPPTTGTSGTTPPPPAGPVTVVPAKKSINKIFFIIGGAIILAVIGLAAATLLNKKTVQSVTINYWGLWEDPAPLESIIAEYESKNPGIKINYIKNQKDDYRSRLVGRLEKDPTTVDEVPDIFRIHTTWLPMFSGKLSPVPAAVKNAIGLDTDYYASAKEDLKSGSNYYAIPLMYDQLAMFYNKDLVNSAQVSIPRSWWELQEAAKKLTVSDPNTGRISVAGAALGLTENVDHWSDVVGLMLKQSGANPLASDESNAKKIKDTLTFYTLFKTQYKVWDESLPTSTEAFAQGKLGFYFAPSWRVFDIEQTKIPTLNYEIAPVPQLTTNANSLDAPVSQANLTNINWSTYWVEAVNAKSKNQAEAWKFLEYLSSKETLQKLYTAESQVRSFGEIYPRKSMATMLSTNTKVAPFLANADTGTNWYLCSRTFDDGLNDGMVGYFKNAINGMVTTNQTADSVWPTLQSGINQLATRYQLR